MGKEGGSEKERERNKEEKGEELGVTLKVLGSLSCFRNLPTQLGMSI